MILSNDLCPSLRPSLQQPSSLRTLLFSKVKSAYLFRLKPENPYFAFPRSNRSPKVLLRRLLCPDSTSHTCNVSQKFYAMNILFCIEHKAFLQRFVSVITHSHHIGPTPGSLTSRLYRASHPFTGMSESQCRCFQALPCHSIC